MKPGPVVCHLSFNHNAKDDRIYWKELMALKAAGYQPVHISVGDETADFISEQGIRIISVKRKTKSSHPLFNRLLQWVSKRNTTAAAVLAKARELKAAVYHYHDLQLNAIARQLKELPHQPAVVYDAHEAYHLLMLEEQPGNFLRRIPFRLYVRAVQAWERRAAAQCDHIFVTDPYSLQYFSKVLKVPVSLLYNYSFFTPAPTAEKKDFDLIYTGLMNRSRGIMEILQAIKLLKKILPSLKLLLIGPFESNEFEAGIHKWIAENGIGENVILHAPVPFAQMEIYYRRSRVGLGIFHPTPKYRTFIPIKLFEYMAFGLPVVFSNHGPSAEMIADAACGLLANPLDPTGISAAIEQLLTDEKLYDQMSLNAQEAVRTKYNWQNEKAKLIKVYEELLSKKFQKF